jgi:hypothetical protein
VAGLGGAEVQRLAGHWCAALCERTEAVAAPAFHVGGRPLEGGRGEVHEERFGAMRMRLGRDLLAEPAEVVRRVIVSGGGG